MNHKFDELLQVLDTLLGPQGCPWDREQTLKSMRSSVLEETCELIEAIDLNDNEKILEELGDLFFNAVFFAKLAEKENRFKLDDVIDELRAKLIRRHPHVFGEVNLNDTDAVIKQWEQIKGKEKGKEHRKSALDSIPKNLPALARAQKVVKKMRKAEFLDKTPVKETQLFENEDDLGHVLLALVSKAEESGLNAEHALKKVLAEKERAFRSFEKN